MCRCPCRPCPGGGREQVTRGVLAAPEGAQAAELRQERWLQAAGSAGGARPPLAHPLQTATGSSPQCPGCPLPAQAGWGVLEGGWDQPQLVQAAGEVSRHSGTLRGWSRHQEGACSSLPHFLSSAAAAAYRGHLPEKPPTLSSLTQVLLLGTPKTGVGWGREAQRSQGRAVTWSPTRGGEPIIVPGPQEW